MNDNDLILSAHVTFESQYRNELERYLIERGGQFILDLPTVKLVMQWPVSTAKPGAIAPWWIAVRYGQEYNGGQVHTGIDLNLSGFGDSGAAVLACADGIVRFAGRVSDAWLSVVVIEHVFDDGRALWSRYAHIDPVRFPVGSAIKRGDLVGHIADYGRKGKQDDHLHFDLAWRDLGAAPGDWPGKNKSRVLSDYVDPMVMIPEHLL